MAVSSTYMPILERPWNVWYADESSSRTILLMECLTSAFLNSQK